MIGYQMEGFVNPGDDMELQRLADEKTSMERAMRLIKLCDTRVAVNNTARQNITKAYCRAISEIERRIEEIEK